MSELSPERLADRETYRARVAAYISLQAKHLIQGCFENDDDPIEGKNT